MASLADTLLKESGARSVGAYARRVHLLAALYLAIFLICVAGEILLFRYGHLYITLAQRSNVETLTLAFFILFYGYLIIVSFPGVRGTLRLLAASWGDRAQREHRKARRLRGGKHQRVAVLNKIVEISGGAETELPLADRYGMIGRIEFRGVRLIQHSSLGDGSNNLFAFIVERIKALPKDPPAQLDIVEWKSLDDEEAEKFGCLAEFAQNLERVHGTRLWPRVELSREEWAELRDGLAALCPALRSEAFLPDWEYAGEHKIPVIPEPLGIISLGRKEKRVDPLASMLSCFITVLISFVVLVLIVWRPPWVPG